MKIRHHHPARARNLLFTFLLLLATAGSSGIGCGDPSAALDVPTAQALRSRFPEQADAVLAADEAFRSTPQGFSLQAPNGAAASRALEMTLPRDGRGVLRLRDRGGFEVQVREMGVEGEGTAAERAVTYRRAGGTSFWSAAPGGVEEWLHLEAGAARGGEPVAVWEVEGATVHARGKGVELVDAGGMVRLSVTAPAAYAAGGRVIQAWMSGQGKRIELWVEPQEQAVLIDPLWTSAGTMTTPRRQPTATLLPSGQVLVVGGQDSAGSFLASAELYDPATSTWKSAGSMSTARRFHTATLLPNGQVLVIGGLNSTVNALGNAELYEPTTGIWKPAAPLITPHAAHTATLLPNGQVLIVAGSAAGGYSGAAELYDPASNSWKTAASIGYRNRHTATLLPNGQVLVVGGLDPAGEMTSATLYEPTTNIWKPSSALITARRDHSATLLPSGQVIVVGGYGSGAELASAELYDPSTDTWKPTGLLTATRYSSTTTLLPSGQVLVVGGGYNANNGLQKASTELYDPATNTWKPGASLTLGRDDHTATLLPNGQVLVAGGFSNALPLASAELYTSCTSSAICQFLASGECEIGFCDLSTATCLATHQLDGAPCSGGVCIAGGCFPESTASVSSSGSSISTSSTAAGSGASSGGGTGPVMSSGVTTSASSGGMTITSSGVTTGTGAASSGYAAGAGGGGTSEAGDGGQPPEIRLHGGAACGASRGGAAEGTPWLVLGLLLVRRRRVGDVTTERGPESGDQVTRC